MTLLATATAAAVAGAVVASVLSAGVLLRPRLEPWARRAVAVAAALTALPLVVLAVAFLRGDLGLFYVWQNVHLSSPWWLRLAGVWGGQAGTFLLWGGLVLGLTWLDGRWREGENGPYVRVILVVLATVLLVPPLLLGLGQATAELGLGADGGFHPGAPGPGPLDLRPDGQGLNPLLDSPYMAIHPPIEFVAYGLAALPFAYGIVGLARGGAWQAGATRWARWAWLAFATALALGALWAYNVLSFGGYWAWDPVETADLLPFLSLTIFLHARVVQKRSGHLGLLAPAAASLAFVLTVLATFVTRGGLWSSVHAFLPTGVSVAIQDPGLRLVRIVSQELSPRFSTGLLVAVTGLWSGALWLFHARTLDSDRGWAYPAAVASASAVGLIGLLGLLFPVTTTSLLHRLALLLGVGRPLAGAMGLMVLAGLPLLIGILRAPDETPLHVRDRTGQLTLAAYALVLILAATTVLLVLGVNGYDREVFDARAPFLAAPVLGLIVVAFWPGPLQRRLLVLAAAAGVSLLALVVTGSWAWAAGPLCLAAAAGPGFKLAKRAHPTGGTRARVRAGLLLASGILGLAHWASPGHVALLGVGLSSPTWYVPVGLAASLLAILAPWWEDRGLAWWVGPLAGVLAVGYGLGALAAAGAWIAHRGRVPGPRAGLRTAGVPLIHLAVALLVLGVAVSTYAQTVTTFPQSEPLERGVPQAVGPYEIELVDGALIDTDGVGKPEFIEAVVHVRKAGVFLSEERLRLEFSRATGFTTQGSYVPEDSQVTRGPWEDLILDADPSAPLSIRVGGTDATWVTANAPPPDRLGGQVDAVSLGVARTPLVNLVWGALPLLAAGLLLRVSPVRGR